MINELRLDATLAYQSQPEEQELKLIHQYADQSSTLEDFARVTLTAITDRPVFKDGLRLIVSREFQNFHVKNFIGKSLVDDHSASKQAVRGRIFDAQVLMKEDGTTYTQVKAFIPKIESNKETIERIRLGQDKDCSLGFRFSNYQEIEINGVPHIKILPGNEDEITELSLVGTGACAYPACGVTKVAASKDKTQDEQLSPADRECLLFGRMMKANMTNDVVSYERQLGLVTDVRLARESYQSMSPFTLQDRRNSLLNTLKSKEQQDTQCSIDAEALLSADTWEKPAQSVEEQRTKLDAIVASLKENN